MTIQKFPIVILGAGFGGLQAAQSLAQSGKDVLLIDRRNYHTFVPLLYQVATAQLEPEHIIYPARTIIRRARHRHFLLAEVEQIDFSAQIIKTNRAEIEYDFLVVATGSKAQYLGVPGAEEHAFSISERGGEGPARHRSGERTLDLIFELLAKFVVDWGFSWWFAFPLAVGFGVASGMVAAQHTLKSITMQHAKAQGLSSL